MTTREMAMCPDFAKPGNYCMDGQRFQICNACHGEGILEQGETCPICKGSGEIAMGACPTCDGTGEVPAARAHLADADAWVRRQEPAWNGMTREKPYTVYARAAWYRFRQNCKDPVAYIAGGQTFQQTDMDGKVVQYDLPGVTFFTGTMRPLLTLHGLSWGYGGEGPNGLAQIVADCWDTSIDGALKVISELPQDRAFVLRPDQFRGVLYVDRD